MNRSAYRVNCFSKLFVFVHDGDPYSILLLMLIFNPLQYFILIPYSGFMSHELLAYMVRELLPSNALERKLQVPALAPFTNSAL